MEPDQNGLHKGRILIVDDDLGTREALRLHVLRLGHHAEAVSGGEAALQRLQDERFDMVLLDVIMPGMQGHEVLAAIKGSPELGHIPVVMVSAWMTLAVWCVVLKAGRMIIWASPLSQHYSRRDWVLVWKKGFTRPGASVSEYVELTQRRLQHELDQAASYVASILPPFEEGH